MNTLKKGDKVYFRSPIGVGRFKTETGTVEKVYEKAGTADVKITNSRFAQTKNIRLHNLNKTKGD